METKDYSAKDLTGMTEEDYYEAVGLVGEPTEWDKRCASLHIQYQNRNKKEDNLDRSAEEQRAIEYDTVRYESNRLEQVY